MTIEQFKVVFSAENRISPILTQISREMENLYNRSTITANALRQVGSGVNVGNLQQFGNALTRVASGLNRINANQQNNLAQTMQAASTAAQQATQQVQQLVQQLQQLRGMRNININVNQTGGGGAGGGAGGAGGAAAGGAMNFQRYLHIYNSVTYALGTLNNAFHFLQRTIADGNELTQTQATLMALVSAQGYRGADAMNAYSQAMGLAIENQLKFGGSLSENANQMMSVQQIAHTYGVSVGQLNRAIQLLALKDPIQGTKYAAVALQELMSGETRSLHQRFELSSGSVRKLKDYSDNTSKQLEALTQILADQGLTMDVLNQRINTVAGSYNKLGAVVDNFAQVAGQGLATVFQGQAEWIAQLIAGMQFMGYYQEAQRQGLQDIRQVMDDNTRAIYEGYVEQGLIIDEFVKHDIEVTRAASEAAIAKSQERKEAYIRHRREEREVMAGNIAVDMLSIEKSDELIKRQQQSNYQLGVEMHLRAATILAKTDEAKAAMLLAQATSMQIDAAKELLDLTIKNEQLGDKKNYEKYYGITFPDSSSVSDFQRNTQRMTEIYTDAMDKLLEYDKDIYRKRIQEAQAFYAYMVQSAQRMQYEMTANDLDLVEGKNSKLDDKDRQRLLARENIEKYAQLQMQEASRNAEQFAMNGQAKFAKEYLTIQQSRVKDTEELNWKLHDTMVRLEGDPEAQERAKEIYKQALGDLETYYNTRIGLAQAAANQEGEEERAARKKIIEDAIAGVMDLQDVDETKRQNIIDGLNIAKTTISDLSGVYIDRVDAMRGSLILLAQAMQNVRDSASILTPEQLAMFNGLPSNQISAPGSNLTVTTTNVNVGGISVSVTSQADPNEIAQTVLRVIQSQQNQRGP